MHELWCYTVEDPTYSLPEEVLVVIGKGGVVVQDEAGTQLTNWPWNAGLTLSNDDAYTVRVQTVQQTFCFEMDERFDVKKACKDLHHVRKHGKKKKGGSNQSRGQIAEHSNSKHQIVNNLKTRVCNCKHGGECMS